MDGASGARIEAQSGRLSQTRLWQWQLSEGWRLMIFGSGMRRGFNHELWLDFHPRRRHGHWRFSRHDDAAGVRFAAGDSVATMPLPASALTAYEFVATEPGLELLRSVILLNSRA